MKLYQKTEWHLFKKTLDTFIDLNIPITTEAELDKVFADLTK